MYKSVSQSKSLQLNNSPFAGFLVFLIISLLPRVVPFLFPPAHSLLCFLSPVKAMGGLDTIDRQARIQIQDGRPAAGGLRGPEYVREVNGHWRWTGR